MSSHTGRRATQSIPVRPAPGCQPVEHAKHGSDRESNGWTPQRNQGDENVQDDAKDRSASAARPHRLKCGGPRRNLARVELESYGPSGAMNTPEVMLPEWTLSQRCSPVPEEGRLAWAAKRSICRRLRIQPSADVLPVCCPTARGVRHSMQQRMPICRQISETGATGLEPATSGVTGHFERSAG
jgi:hypothetical protein